jgi:hypothetical protein
MTARRHFECGYNDARLEKLNVSIAPQAKENL